MVSIVKTGALHYIFNNPMKSYPWEVEKQMTQIIPPSLHQWQTLPLEQLSGFAIPVDFFGMQGFPLTDARVRESVSTLETTGPNYRTPVFVDCTEGPSGLRRVGVLWFQAEEDLSWPWLPCEEQGLAGSPHAQIRASSLGPRPGKPPSPGSTSSLVCGWSWKET